MFETGARSGVSLLCAALFCTYNRRMAALRLLDSISQIQAEDTGCLAVSGSHGGISAARFAATVGPLLSVFNDAGGGKDDAGLVALDFLQSRALAACTVAHTSARIGDARSTLEDGVVNHLNALAAALGIRAGQRLQPLIQSLAAQA